MSLSTNGRSCAASAPSFSVRVVRVSDGSIGTRCIRCTGPWSSSSSSLINATPVSSSPLSRASWIGEAPRYLGRSEG